MTATASNSPSPAVPAHDTAGDTATFLAPAPAPDLPVPVDPATLAELSADIANDVLAAHRGRWPELDAVAYVAHPEPADCGQAAVCHPLREQTAESTGGPPHRRGHLHYAPAEVPGGDTGADGGSAQLPSLLDLVADLIDAGVARDLLDCQVVTERRRADQIASALTSNRTIGMAIGVLMALRQLTPEQAFTELRTASQNHNRKLRDIATDVVHTGTLAPAPPHPSGPQSPPATVRGRQHIGDRRRGPGKANPEGGAASG